MAILFLVLLFLFFLIILLFPINKRSTNKVVEDATIYRDIPCNKDLFFAYWVGVNYGLIDKKEDFFGAVLLKWIHDGNVRLEKIQYKGKKVILSSISLLKRPKRKMECKLYDYMFSASMNGKLDVNEFTSWCKIHAAEILGWFNDVIYFESINLMKQKKLILKDDVKMQFFDCKYFDKASSLEEEAKKLAGLKKFFKEFTLIKDKDVVQVNLWNEYLMYAQMFGMADKVAAGFAKMYPDVIQNMNKIGYGVNDVISINSFAVKSIKIARSFNLKNISEYSNYSRDSSYKSDSFHSSNVGRAVSYGSKGSGGRGFSSRRGGSGSFGRSSRGGGGFR